MTAHWLKYIDRLDGAFVNYTFRPCRAVVQCLPNLDDRTMMPVSSTILPLSAVKNGTGRLADPPLVLAAQSMLKLLPTVPARFGPVLCAWLSIRLSVRA